MVQGVLLDVDGTLVESNDAHAEAWVKALQHFGYNVSFSEIRQRIGMGGDNLLPEVVPGLQANEGEGKKVADLRKQLFLTTFASRLKPTPGAKPFVALLKEHTITPIIASSSSKEELDALLRIAQINDLIDLKTTAQDVKNTKPAPDVVAIALQKLALPPKSVLMVGDTPYDIEAATKIGVQTVAVRSGGFSDTELKGAIAIYDNPEDIFLHFSTSPFLKK